MTLAGFRVFHEAGGNAVLHLTTFRQLERHLGGDILVAAIEREQPLGVVAGSQAHIGIREVNHVRIPIVMLVLGKQRCIAGHLNHITIALYITQEKRLGQRTLMGTCLRSIFANIHLRPLTVVAVVIVEVVHKPACGLVVMLIHHVEHLLMLLRKSPTLDIIGRRSVERTYSTANLNLRIAATYLLANHEATLLEGSRDDVFVTDADILQMERLRMAGICTHLRPLAGGRIAIGPLYQVAQFVDVGRHLLHRDTALLSAISMGIGTGVLARHAGSQHGQRLGTDILAELEILIESQSTGLMVIPNVEIGFAVLQRTHGVRPMIDIIDAIAMAHASTREAHELRMQTGNCLSQVAAQSVLTSFECVLREERNHVDRRTSFLQWHQSEPCLGGGKT